MACAGVGAAESNYRRDSERIFGLLTAPNASVVSKCRFFPFGNAHTAASGTMPLTFNDTNVMDFENTYFSDAWLPDFSSSSRQLVEHYGPEFAVSLPTLYSEWLSLRDKTRHDFCLRDHIAFENASHDLACIGYLVTRNRKSFAYFAGPIAESALQRLTRYHDEHTESLIQRKGLSPFVSICDALAAKRYVEAKRLAEVVIENNILDILEKHEIVINTMKTLPYLLTGDSRIWDSWSETKRHLCGINLPLALIYDGILSSRPATCEAGLRKLVREMELSCRVDKHIGILNTVALGLANLCRWFRLDVASPSRQVPGTLLIAGDELKAYYREYGDLFEIPVRPNSERSGVFTPNLIEYVRIPSRNEFWNNACRLDPDQRMHRRKIELNAYAEFLVHAFLLMTDRFRTSLHGGKAAPFPKLQVQAFDCLDIKQKIWIIHRVAFSLFDPDTPICEGTIYGIAAAFATHHLVTIHIANLEKMPDGNLYKHEQWRMWGHLLRCFFKDAETWELFLDELKACAVFIKDYGGMCRRLRCTRKCYALIEDDEFDIDIFDHCRPGSKPFWHAMAELEDGFLAHIPPIPKRASCYTLLLQIEQLCTATLAVRANRQNAAK